MRIFSIKYTFEHLLIPEDYCYPNVDELFGEIFLINEEEIRTKIGQIKLDYYNYDFGYLDFNMYNAFDRSGDTFDVGQAIIEANTGQLKFEVEEILGGRENYNILVIQEFTLFPQFRNKGFGKELIKLIEIFFKGKAGIVALKSFPRQHDITLIGEEIFNQLEFYLLEQNLEIAQASLNKFYEKCGYLKVPGFDNFYIKNIDFI